MNFRLYTQLACLLGMTYLLSACGDDDDVNDILLTYSLAANYLNDGESFIVVLTDSEGNLLDSAQLSNGQTVSFENTRNLREYTLSEIQSANSTLISIRTYANTIISNFTKEDIDFNDESAGSVTLLVEENSNRNITAISSLRDNNDTVIQGPGTSVEIGSFFPILYLISVENGVSSYQLLENLTPGENINIDLDNFQTLSLRTITYESTNLDFSSITVSSVLDEAKNIRLSLTDFPNSVDLNANPPTFLIPENLFTEHLFEARFEISDGKRRRYSNFGVIPTNIPEFSIDFDVESVAIDNQQIDLEGEVDRILTIWFEQFETNGETISVSWGQNWPNTIETFDAPDIVYEIATGRSNLSGLEPTFLQIERYSDADYNDLVEAFNDVTAFNRILGERFTVSSSL